MQLRQALVGQVDVGRFEYRWTAGHQGMLGRTHTANFHT